MIENHKSIRSTTLESIFHSATDGIDDLLDSLKLELDKNKSILLLLNSTEESVLHVENNAYKKDILNGNDKLFVGYQELLDLIQKIRKNYSNETINFLTKKWFGLELSKKDFYLTNIDKKLFNEKIEYLQEFSKNLINKVILNDEYKNKKIVAEKIINLIFSSSELNYYEIGLKSLHLIRVLEDLKQSNCKDWNTEFILEINRLFLATHSKGNNYSLGFKFEIFFDRKSRLISFSPDSIEKLNNSKLEKFFLNKLLNSVVFEISEIIKISEIVSEEEIVKQNLSKSLIEFYEQELLDTFKEKNLKKFSFMEDVAFWFLPEETIISNSLNKFNETFNKFTLEEKKQILLLLQKNLK